ncbi:MAG TPA: DNA mismatch repair protein MutS [Thermoplasmata archaeon]|nr:DNA mismatch repair protein MutS [Thermoplasmata archaeon]
MSAPPSTTPLMEQYGAAKAQYPGHLVLIRVGDFFEGFGDDARLLARELDVVLTARAPDVAGQRTPMAGVPWHAIDSYLARLVRKGYKVALCDQVEDPKFAHGIVRRAVTRVVTPGTAIEDRLLPGPEHNFLAAVAHPDGAPAGYAAVDVTTGELFTGAAEGAGPLGLLLGLAPFGPRELLVPVDGAAGSGDVERLYRAEFPAARIERAPAPVDPAFLPAGLAADVAALPAGERQAALLALEYVRTSQPRLLPFIESTPRPPPGRRLRLDAKTLRHLEITRPMNLDDATGPTLLSSWDETRTAPGRRLFGFWLRNPLADAGAIASRQDAVEALRATGARLSALREHLGSVSDLSRIASRLAGRRLRPPELSALRASLEAVAQCRTALSDASLPGPARALGERLDSLPELAERLRAAVPERPPPEADDRGLFRPGVFPELDALATEERAALEELTALEKGEQERTGIRSLRIRYNQVFGYYLEVTRPHLARVPAEYRRKQSVSGAERFTSDALAEVERRVLSARERAAELEAGLWERFLGELDAWVPKLYRLARAVGELDVLASFAWTAQSRGFLRPIVDESGELLLRDGRHPVLDRQLGERFVPNDTELDLADARLLVLTGPNMSGKSTYMRQVGLLVVLAQVGAFLPARHARIGLVSSLHTRMGFTDEIGRGKSSFFVEMAEVAEILRGADERSLVLLDEVGRGTSTFDGLALAWATLRYLHDRVRCRTIVATHYHQLTELVATLSGARNAHLAVREDDGEVVLLHRLVPGSTDRSLGLHVARLAGLPSDALAEAERMLRRLEAAELPVAGGSASKKGPRHTQAVLLATVPERERSALERALDKVDPDRLTPLEALAWLHEWKGRQRAVDPPATEPR